MKEQPEIRLHPQRVIPTEGGAVLHGLKVGEPGYQGFGEAYFSEIMGGEVRCWKRHREMTLNLLVPVGAVRLVLFNDPGSNRDGNQGGRPVLDVVLSRDANYQRLTVPPGLWTGFMGMGDGLNLLANIASQAHRADEQDRENADFFEFDWTISPKTIA